AHEHDERALETFGELERRGGLRDFGQHELTFAGNAEAVSGVLTRAGRRRRRERVIEGIAVGFGERNATIARSISCASQTRNKVMREERAANLARFECELVGGARAHDGVA